MTLDLSTGRQYLQQVFIYCGKNPVYSIVLQWILLLLALLCISFLLGEKNTWIVAILERNAEHQFFSEMYQIIGYLITTQWRHLNGKGIALKKWVEGYRIPWRKDGSEDENLWTACWRDRCVAASTLMRAPRAGIRTSWDRILCKINIGICHYSFMFGRNGQKKTGSDLRTLDILICIHLSSIFHDLWKQSMKCG